MVTRLLKGNQVAEVLNVSRSQAYRMMRNGEIPTIRFGKSIRVNPDDLDTFMQNRRTESRDESNMNWLINGEQQNG